MKLAGSLMMLVLATTCGDAGALGAPAATRTGVPMQLASPAFANGEQIPVRYTGDGDDVSPPLRWRGVPTRAVALVLVCEHSQGPGPHPWTHWLVANLPATTRGLPEAVPAGETIPEVPGTLQGRNSWREMRYAGPARSTAAGGGRYAFTLYALSAPLRLEAGFDRAALLRAMEGHVLAHATLVGVRDWE